MTQMEDALTGPLTASPSPPQAFIVAGAESLFSRALAGHLPPMTLVHPAESLAQLADAGDRHPMIPAILLPDDRVFTLATLRNWLTEQQDSRPALLIPAAAQPIDAALAARAQILPRPFSLAAWRHALHLLAVRRRTHHWPGIGSFDAANLSLSTGAHSLPLTEREAALLDYFIHRAMESAPRKQLLTELWGHRAELETHTLETHLSRLRAKLKELFGEALTITLDEAGYRLDSSPPPPQK